MLRPWNCTGCGRIRCASASKSDNFSRARLRAAAGLATISPCQDFAGDIRQPPATDSSDSEGRSGPDETLRRSAQGRRSFGVLRRSARGTVGAAAPAGGPPDRFSEASATVASCGIYLLNPTSDVVFSARLHIGPGRPCVRADELRGDERCSNSSALLGRPSVRARLAL